MRKLRYMPNMDSVLTISEVSRRSGVASSALRVYEERGLVMSERAGSGHRRFPRAVPRRVPFIVFAQRIGLNLEEIGAELAKLPTDRNRRAATDRASRANGCDASTGGCWADLSIGCGCLSIDRCQLANPADRACRSGSGPRYWLGWIKLSGRRRMITGTHVVIHTRNAEADRAFFRDVLAFSWVDAGDGWLIFAAPPSEVACHPARTGNKQELYPMCDEVQAEIARLAKKGVACGAVSDQGWGLLTTIRLPGGGDLGLYEPRHAIPRGLARRSRSKQAKAGPSDKISKRGKTG